MFTVPSQFLLGCLCYKPSTCISSYLCSMSETVSYLFDTCHHYVNYFRPAQCCCMIHPLSTVSTESTVISSGRCFLLHLFNAGCFICESVKSIPAIVPFQDSKRASRRCILTEGKLGRMGASLEISQGR